MLGTMKGFIERTKLPVRSLEIKAWNEEATAPSRIRSIYLLVSGDGNLTPSEEEQLIRVAKGCKIHNALDKSIVVGIKLDIKPGQSEEVL